MILLAYSQIEMKKPTMVVVRKQTIG